MFLNGRAAGGFGRPDEVYPVFGKSKRKQDFEEEGFQQPGMETQTEVQAAKRQRSENWVSTPRLRSPHAQQLLDQEINHNLPLHSQVDMEHDSLTMEDQPQQQFAAQPQFAALQQQPQLAAQQQFAALQQFAAPAQDPQAEPQSLQRRSVSMNINDETYSCYNHEMEEMAMDSDGVPDPHQYKTENMIFPCGDNCIGGEHSPTTGRVKCYCRPSWEGMVGVVPYFSDYY